MLVPIQLAHEQEIFDVLTEVFEQAEREGRIDDTRASDERDSYGNEGYINITINGRHFTVEIGEIVY